MLPVITPDIREALEKVIQDTPEDWKKEMVHHLKEDNPEINSLLLSLAQDSPEAKKIILAGFMVYKALEMAEEKEEF